LVVAILTVNVVEREGLRYLVLPTVVGYGLYALGMAKAFPRRNGLIATALTDARSVPEQQSGVDWLLLIRCLAAVIVFIMHSGIVLGRDFTYGGSPWAWVIFSPAWLGMVMFFALSGYLMGKGFYRGKYSPDRAGVVRFLKNRWWRIAPLILAVGFLVVVLQVPDWLNRGDLALRLTTFSFNGLVTPPALGAAWSLSTEWQFYLLVPILFVGVAWVIRRGGPWSIALLMVGSVVVVSCVRLSQWLTGGAWNPFIYTPVYCNLDVFLVGFLSNWVFGRTSASVRAVLGRSWALLLVALVLAYSWIAYPVMAQGEPGFRFVFQIILPGAAALLMCPILIGAEAANEAWQTRPLQTARARLLPWLLNWAGALTYPIYLVHSPVLISVEKGLPDAPYLFRLALSIGLTLALSVGLHLTVERAALARRTRAVARPSGDRPGPGPVPR
jgi:peptidoglycan/LPS O-acetylase OafA/YrhL